MNDKLKLKLGAIPDAEFELTLGDVKLHDKLCIKSLTVKAEANTTTKIILECYLDECDVEILPEGVTINIIEREVKDE